jgi:predicted nucleotidyltransferase
MAMPRTLATEIIEELRRGIDNVLSASVLGAYIFGSYVLGDFDERLSDIDLLVVTRLPVSDDELRALSEMHSNLVTRHPEWDNRVEVMYLDVTTLRAFRDGGDVIRISPGEPLHRTAFLQHWLVDLYTVQESGLTILGAEANEVLPHIAEDEFKTSIGSTVEEWLDWMRGTLQERYLAYIRLALCRGLFAFRFGKQTSKPAAALWVAQEYPEWAEVASEAVQWRQLNSQSENEAGLIRTEEFGRFVFGATRTETSSALTQSRIGVGTSEANAATMES